MKTLTILFLVAPGHFLQPLVVSVLYVAITATAALGRRSQPAPATQTCNQ